MRTEPSVETHFAIALPPCSEGAKVVFENEHVTVKLEAPAEGPVSQIHVTLKHGELLSPGVPPEPQCYPDIPLEQLFENERMIVQRVKVAPGQFEGVHSHPGNQVFVHIKGGRWRARKNGVQTGPVIHREPGDCGWMNEIDISEGHEYGNVGDTTIDLVWITLK